MRHLACAFLLSLLALGCGSSASNSTGGTGGNGGSTTSSSSSGTTTTTTTATGGSGGSPNGDCHADADCPDGKCVEVTPGGFHVCQTPPLKATICASDLDQCCADKPCPDNAPCYGGPLVPHCAGAQLEPYNQCAVDQCTQDADCAPGQLCALAGTLGRLIRACLPAGCKVDADCAATPGGICAPVQEPCCGTVAGLFCVYPTGGCRTNGDCASTQYCEIDGDLAMCKAGTPICPQ